MESYTLLCYKVNDYCVLIVCPSGCLSVSVHSPNRFTIALTRISETPTSFSQEEEEAM